MSHETENRKWYQAILTPQTLIYFVGAVVATVVFWYRTQESWAKVKELEATVTRQWGLQRDMNEGNNKRIYDIEKWVEYYKGYEQARKDYTIKQ